MGDLRTLLPGLNADELAALQACSVVEAEGRRTSLADLASGWAAHVNRFELESGLSWDDAAAWTEHDFVGALHLRDRLARALDQAPTAERQLAEGVLVGVDSRFKGFTGPDSRRLLARVLPGEELGTSWWWQRIPLKGPVLEGLLRLPQA